jgi:UDP-N-acetylglucosamine:LPS N-acetylglucosamine transferase
MSSRLNAFGIRAESSKASQGAFAAYACVDTAISGNYTLRRMKRIDIYTIDIGGGHIAPAEAIKEQFALLGHEDLEVRVVNIALQLGARLMRTIYKSYWNLALHYPPLINAFYSGADNPFGIKMFDRLLGISILPRFKRYLDREKPDLIVSTYFSFTHYLELFKRLHQIDATCVILNPEPFDAHFIWFSPAFDWSMVFSKKSFDEIVEKGIPGKRVKVFPFPINPLFAKRPESKQDLRRSLGIAVEPFTFLFFFGAEGRGPARKYLDAMAARGINAQVIVVCGKNKKLLAEMEQAAAHIGGGIRIVARGFINDLPEYISASDIVVGKSGPNQVFESLIQERPIVISSYLANERQTSDWVIANGLGWLCRTDEQFGMLAARLVAHPELIVRCERNIRAIGLRSGTPEICEFLYGLLGKGAGTGAISKP